GELVDVIGNFNVVRAFGATVREQRRFGRVVEGEMTARRTSLLYLERLRLIHAVLTAILTAGLVGWAILMWQRGQATAGDIVLITSLGLPTCPTTPDLAGARFDPRQPRGGFEERIARFPTDKDRPDHPQAGTLAR